jgi:hypothetical protein
MDTYQLRHVLTRDLGPSFEGVYPRDLLQEFLDQIAIVINTDPLDQSGAHWVCVYLNSPVVEYWPTSTGTQVSRVNIPWLFLTPL